MLTMQTFPRAYNSNQAPHAGDQSRPGEEELVLKELRPESARVPH
jgi:hypothetical protein